MSLIDHKFLQKFVLTALIHTMPTLMTVRSIGQKQHNTNKFAIFDFYLPTEHHLVAYFQQEIHIVDSLDINALISLDITVPEG